MDPKAELLVFNKKEIFVIITLLVLVALFSFTLGLKLGKTLGSGGIKAQQAEHAPLAEHDEQAVEKHAADENAHGEAPHDEVVKKPAETSQPKQTAEDHADAEFSHEADKEKVGSGKVVPMALPKDKKGEGGPRYTLQVGSHRTVAEATEQVAALKQKGLDAFYLEAQLAGKGTWYRVGVGVFTTKEEAERTSSNLKSKGLPAFIVQKLGD